LLHIAQFLLPKWWVSAIEDTLYESNFESIQATVTRGNTKGKHVRNYFAKYFTSPHVAVPLQHDKV
jgi:hypothetical protein